MHRKKLCSFSLGPVYPNQEQWQSWRAGPSGGSGYRWHRLPASRMPVTAQAYGRLEPAQALGKVLCSSMEMLEPSRACDPDSALSQGSGVFPLPCHPLPLSPGRTERCCLSLGTPENHHVLQLQPRGCPRALLVPPHFPRSRPLPKCLTLKQRTTYSPAGSSLLSFSSLSTSLLLPFAPILLT